MSNVFVGNGQFAAEKTGLVAGLGAQKIKQILNTVKWVPLQRRGKWRMLCRIGTVRPPKVIVETSKRT
jgi:hypothetical protein